MPFQADISFLKIIYSLKPLEVRMTFALSFPKYIGRLEYFLTSPSFWLLKIKLVRLQVSKDLWTCVQHNGLKVWLSGF